MSELHEEISCRYGGLCGGCPWIKRPIEEQRKEKLKGVGDLFPQDQVRILSPGVQALRDRVDLTVKRVSKGKSTLGLWSLRSSGRDLKLNERELVDIETCAMMTPALEAWFKEFRSRLPDVELGSVRLRVSPSGERGVWLDFSNEDVKRLFEEKEYLRWLSSKAVVEIGQKKKPLYFDDSEGELRPRLKKEVELRPWFQTWDLNGKAYPVYGAIGGFSQSGLIANRTLVEEVLRVCKQVSAEASFWLEAFCGSGNFTYPLATEVDQVLAFENDPVAMKSLEKGLQESRIKNVSLKRVDLKSKRQLDGLLQELPKEKAYGLLADPPRSGLMKLVDFMEEGVISPQVLIYVSCFTGSLMKDSEKLKSLGYDLQSLSLVDQFPHSPHVEWVSLWTKLRHTAGSH